MKIGEPLPPLVLDNVFNYKSDKLNLGDLTGKPLIIYFWATNCYSCLAFFEKIDTFQKEFGKKLHFIMVNPEGYEFTRRFLAKRKKLIIPAAPFVTGDTMLGKIFPRTKEVSYSVWLDATGIVKYKSASSEINATTIQNFLNEKEMQFGPRINGWTKINAVINREYENQIQFFSYITKCINGSQPSFSDSFRRKFAHIISRCVSEQSLYQKAYFIKDSFYYDRPARTWFDLASSNDYVKPIDYTLKSEWLKSHMYNYELVLPISMKKRAGSIMIQDLDRFFGFKSGVEMKEVECMILKRVGDRDLLKSKGGSSYFGLERSDITKTIEDPIRGIRNKPFMFLSTRLQAWIEMLKKIPFLDETGYSGNIDIDFDGQIIEKFELDELKNALEKYGLTLVKEKRFIKTLVIRESE